MKKNLLLILLLFLQTAIHSQSTDMVFNKPVASVSSLSTYTNTPVSYATGTPNISVPLLSMQSNRKDIDIKMMLSYHPMNLISSEKSSEVGLGWSVLGATGVISREIVKGLDERFRDPSNPKYIKNEFDDIYYYTVGDYSGKFRVIRDINANTFQIVKLTPSSLKIEYTRESNPATLIFNSFTITDDKGYIYSFNTYSTSEYKEGSFGIAYKSAFYLSKIASYNNQELVNFEYQTDTYTSLSLSVGNLQTCKLKKIISKDNGSVEFNYSLDESLRKSFNDPYQMNSVTVKTSAGNIVTKYEMQYSFMQFTNPEAYYLSVSKRILWKLKKYNNALDKTELTEFEYEQVGSAGEYGPVAGQYKDYFLYTNCYPSSTHNEIENPKYYTLGSLKRMKLPTGGMVEYNFEAHQVYKNKDTSYLMNVSDTEFSDPEILYLRLVKSGNFNTQTSTHYPFTITGNGIGQRLVYVVFRVDEKYPFNPAFDPGAATPFVSYTISGNPIEDNMHICANGDESLMIKKLILPSGNSTLDITGTGGNGYYEIYELAVQNTPIKNKITKKGIRIESIRYFENSSSQTPSKYENFIYDAFDAPAETSGELFTEYPANGGDPSDYIIYKNVKVANGNNGGYTKYYFLTPKAYPSYNDGDQFPYWANTNITKNGLLSKKEVYDASNTLIASEVLDYTLADMDVPKVLFSTDTGNFNTRTAWIKETRTTSRATGQNNEAVTSNTESVRNATDFNTISEKQTHTDGNIIETFYKYAREKNNTALLNSNITGIPLETEVKRNGSTISKSEVKYDNTSLLLPTSVLNYGLDDFSKSYPSVKYDLYDENGNIVQYSTTPDPSTGIGIPTTIIWGYNKTLPIAKIDGAKLSDIPQSLIDAIVNASNEDAIATLSTAQAKETALLNQLEAFKNNTALSAFQVTAYTYNPIVGVTNVIPPNGIREIYQYDSFNRLEKIYNVNGKILKQYQYNYKQ